ncbi:MAG: fluoride efflux transporter CrcB [Bauldia litoralis]
MKLVIAVAAGGAVGAVARYGVYLATGRLLGHGFPWATLIVNIGGCFLLGVLIELMALKWSVSPEIRAFLVLGVMGAFTTFSAFALDVAILAERGVWIGATLYIAASVALSIAAFVAGLRVLRVLLV